MNRYLIIRLGALGDVVLATAAIEAVSRAEPSAQIDFICKERFAGLLRGHPKLNDVMGFDESGRHQGLRGLLLFMHELSAKRYDFVIDLQNSLRSRVLTFCLNGSLKVRGAKDAWGRRMLVWTKRDSGKCRTVLQRNLEAVARAGISQPQGTPRLYPVPHDIAGLPPNGYVVLAPGANRPTKRWMGFAQLLDSLAGSGLEVVITGTEDDREEADQMAGSPECRATNLCGQLSISQLAWVLSRARLAVTNDTGSMHIAEAAGTPVLAIFGPTVRQFGFAPWRSESRIVETALECRPCSLHGSKECPNHHFKCMKLVTPGMVKDALEDILKEGQHGR
jgi:heptosyltransferase-2